MKRTQIRSGRTCRKASAGHIGASGLCALLLAARLIWSCTSMHAQYWKHASWETFMTFVFFHSEIVHCVQMMRVCNAHRYGRGSIACNLIDVWRAQDTPQVQRPHYYWEPRGTPRVSLDHKHLETKVKHNAPMSQVVSKMPNTSRFTISI